MTSVPDVAVIIPTLRRPSSLTRAIRSVQGQLGVQHRLKEIIVVDNDPEATAQALIANLAHSSNVPLVWCHAPVPGVATARNRGLAETTADLIAFLDDDEAASPQWLASLIRAQENLGADVVFGPIQGQVPLGSQWPDYLRDFFGRAGPATDCEIDKAFGCGNSLMLRANALSGPTPFSTSADHSGGEDDVLFTALAARGGRFGWAADAWVDEYAPEHRAQLSYALSRAFAYGQGPSQTAASQKHWGELARWMTIGAGQTLVYGLAAIGLCLIRHPRRVQTYDRTAQGLGKLFWMKVFEKQIYGAQELKRLNQSSASAD